MGESSKRTPYTILETDAGALDWAPVWLFAPNLRSVHGFSTRLGGESRGEFAGLNLSLRVGDDEAAVLENRRVALSALGLEPGRVARLRQVHSARVVRAVPGEAGEGDGLVSGEPGLALAIETADCYPVLLEDAQAGVVGAAHAGWRGTAAGVVASTLREMVALGADPSRVRAAVGPGICGECYEVGPEVREVFEAAGFPSSVWLPSQKVDSGPGTRWRVDLGRANAWLLASVGVPEANIWRSGACNSGPDFFSFRRDGGRTGRMWAVIASGGPT